MVPNLRWWRRRASTSQTHHPERCDTEGASHRSGSAMLSILKKRPSHW
jgi:hypothetical protein